MATYVIRTARSPFQSIARRAGAICTCLSARLDHGEKIFPEQCEELAISAGGSSEELTQHAGACPPQGRVGKTGPAPLRKHSESLRYGYRSHQQNYFLTSSSSSASALAS